MVCQARHSCEDAIRQRDELHGRNSPRTYESVISHQSYLHPSTPRGNGLVERQNRTLLTLLRVYASRRMQEWDEHIDGVLGAYNSTRHATTGFSPYMLQHGAEKSIPLSLIFTPNSQREALTLKKIL